MLWYPLGAGRPWYGLFGVIMFYALLPYLLLKSKKLLYLYLPFAFVTVVLANLSACASNINYLIGKENADEYAFNAVPHYKTAQHINNLNLSSDKKIIIAGDFKAAYINGNDQLIEYIDPYLSKTGYMMDRGENYFYNYLQDNSIQYIIHSRLYTFYESWPGYKNMTLGEYLTGYRGKIPSIYQDTEILKNFLERNAKMVFDDGYYMLYKINNAIKTDDSSAQKNNK